MLLKYAVVYLSDVVFGSLFAFVMIMISCLLLTCILIPYQPPNVHVLQVCQIGTVAYLYGSVEWTFTAKPWAKIWTDAFYAEAMVRLAELED